MSDFSDFFIGVRAAGTLPAVRAEGMFETAMAEGRLVDVMCELQHTWAHYEALELILNAAAADPAVAVDALNLVLGLEGESVESVSGERVAALVLQFIAGRVVDAAYRAAHAAVEKSVEDRTTVTAALRDMFAQLDFSDPTAPLSDENLAAEFPTSYDDGEF